MKDKYNTNPHLALRKFTCQLVLFQDAVARRYGLTPSDMAVYNLIVISSPIMPKEIMERTGLSSGGVTKSLDHLESIGTIIRKPSLDDRRSIVVVPTTANLKQEGVAELDFDAIVKSLFSDLSSKEQSIVEKFLHHANQHLLTETENILTQQAE
jgi:DNA-binding MarR family transcriptional regulator